MKTTTTTTKATSIRLVLLFAVLLVSSFSMSAQSTIAPVALTTTNEVTVATENVSTNATMNFVSWFMGTKQTTNANNSSDVSSSSKKQMINSGIAPNRLLIKAFLKKASNYSSTVA